MLTPAWSTILNVLSGTAVLFALSVASVAFSIMRSPTSTDLALELTALTNSDRLSHGLSPLTPDERLVEIALERSEDMVRRGYFDHAIPPTGDTVLAIL